MKRLMAIALLVAACGVAGPTPIVVYVTPAPTVKPTPIPTPEPTGTPSPLTISGTNDGNTTRFELGPGDYRVVIAGESSSTFGGNVIVSIYNEADDSHTLANEIVDGLAAYEFTTYEYGYGGGRYYLDVLSPGRWSVTFTPEP